MKASQKDFAAAAPRAVRDCRIFYFCGPDEGGASVAAARIAAMLPDAGERVELSGADLRRDPVALADEARSTSLFAGARHLWVRTQGDESAAAVENLVGQIDAGEGGICPVLIIATAATDKSRIAKLLEKRGDALVAMFYPPDLGQVTGAVRTMADRAGIRLNGDLAERLARAAGLDVRLAQSEVDKLALYLGAAPAAPVTATPEAFEEICARTEDDGFAPLVNAVLSGETNRLPGELRRMREMSMSPVAVLLAIERRAAQLAGLATRLGPAGNVERFVEAESKARRIFWKDRRDITVQLQRWRGARIGRLNARLLALHQALLASSNPGETLLAQEITQIARFAATAARPRR